MTITVVVFNMDGSLSDMVPNYIREGSFVYRTKLFWDIDEICFQSPDLDEVIDSLFI